MLYFEDVGDEQELNIMYEALNSLKILFHPLLKNIFVFL